MWQGLLILGIGLLISGMLTGIATGVYRIFQLIFGVCSPASSAEADNLLNLRKVVLVWAVVGGVIGVLLWGSSGWFLLDLFEGFDGSAKTVLFLALVFVCGAIGALSGGIIGGLSILIPVARFFHHVLFFLGSWVVFHLRGETSHVCSHCSRSSLPSKSRYKRRIQKLSQELFDRENC